MNSYENLTRRIEALEADTNEMKETLLQLEQVLLACTRRCNCPLCRAARGEAEHKPKQELH